MKLSHILLCVGLVGCGEPFIFTGTGGATTNSADSTFSVSETLPTKSNVGGAGGMIQCTPLSCGADFCGIMDDGCGSMIDCGDCPSQVSGYPSACLGNICQPFNETIFSPECADVCGYQNDDAWNNCLAECQGQDCTIDESCANCNFLFSAEPDCLPCLHMNFSGQSCGG